MPRVMILAACLVAVTFIALACDSGDDNSGGPILPLNFVSPEPAATSTPEVEIRHTGVAEVDAVIDAVASGDEAAIRELTLFQSVPCVGPTPANLGGPPLCLEDEPFDTIVSVLRGVGCHGDYGRQADILNVISGLPPSPYAAYGADGQYNIVYSYGAGTEAIGAGLVVEEGRITGLTNRCAQGPEVFIEHVPPEQIVLPPPPDEMR